MTSFVSHTLIDSADPYALAQWWKELLAYVDDEDGPYEPGAEEVGITDPDSGHCLLFVVNDDVKTVKNRVHLDLRPRERTRDAEVEWALGIGATFVADHRHTDGSGFGWVVLADPEGNEFCILRSLGEVESHPT